MFILKYYYQIRGHEEINVDFTALTIDILKSLGEITGNYGWGIILLTVIIRLAMWPLGVSQQRSMKTMQMLQPKMKMIQERYKSNPQMMQQKLMEFYKEHKFNPMAGCWPIAIQMPIFILLYSALMSPMFIQVAGNESFYFVKRLDTTLRGNAGMSYDNEFNVTKNDSFSSAKTIKVYLKDTPDPVEQKVSNPRKLVKVQGDIVPGETLDLKISLDDLNMKYSQLEKVEGAELGVIDNNTREIENVKFTQNGDILMAQVPTKEVSSSIHYDVLLLVLIFGASMFLAQKIMMATNKQAAQDPTQAAMQKTMGTMMPIMLTATFIFIPIPAGVLLYLVSSNIIQVAQTIIINKQLDMEEATKKTAKTASDDNLNARKVEAKEVKNVKEDDK